MHNGATFMSKMFRRATAFYPKESNMLSKSQKLLLYTGLIHGGARGTYLLSSMFLRSLDKTVGLIDEAMQSIGAEKVIMPCLADGKLWKRSGRWDQLGSELFRLKDRQMEDLCLAPTHEEEITNYVASNGTVGYKQLPIRLYQITTKFRDEGQPRFGLLRSREFLMKDLYTFDDSKESAQESYNAVCDAYQLLLEKLKVNFVKVEAVTGHMGGSFSQEFHIPAEIGEDELLVCDKCGHGLKVETLAWPKDTANTTCPSCGTGGGILSSTIRRVRAIEVAHCFILGTKYSECFAANFGGSDMANVPLEMGCFGIGVTRLIAAALEALSTDEELRWPAAINPFRASLVLQKAGAKGMMAEGDLRALIDGMVGACPGGDLLVDDRLYLTIGRRLVDLRRLGVPLAVLAKEQQNTPGKLEVIDVYGGRSEFLSLNEILHRLAL